MTVEDTGIGIPEDKLEPIFDKFTQAHGSITEQYGGTGLGLAICHQLVELMDGAISVTSRMGEGSTFSFDLRLPISPAEPAVDPTESARSEIVRPAGTKPVSARVLVVEDNVFNQRVAAEMLRKLGCRVDVAANGLEAVDMIQTFPYDLVFMDCQMPEMDGYEATAQIRHLEPEIKQVPIFAMTANAMQGDRERCLASGMDDYVSKPVRMDYLTVVLNKYLEHPGQLEDSGAINAKVFNSLWEILGDEAPELTRAYLNETEGLLSVMKQALDQSDWADVEKSAHTLKGSSATIGASELLP